MTDPVGESVTVDRDGSEGRAQAGHREL